MTKPRNTIAITNATTNDCNVSTIPESCFRSTFGMPTWEFNCYRSPCSLFFEIGAFDGDHLVAVAELHTGGRIPPGQGESAFSVASDWRHKGLGTRLLKALLRAASEIDVATIIVETGAQNYAMKALARRFGARMQSSGDQATGRINVADGLRLAARKLERWNVPTPPTPRGESPAISGSLI